MTGDCLVFLNGAGIGNALMLTFNPSTSTITMSNAGHTISGPITVAFDTYNASTSTWTTHPTIVSGSGINSGVNVAGASISTSSVDGIRPNMTGSWAGTLKIYILVP